MYLKERICKMMEKEQVQGDTELSRKLIQVVEPK